MAAWQVRCRYEIGHTLRRLVDNKGSYTMQCRNHSVVAFALASTLSLGAVASPALAETGEGQQSTQQTWCLTPAISQGMAVQSVRTRTGTVTAVNAATGVIKVAIAFQVITSKTEASISRTMTESRIKVADVMVTPVTI